IDLVRAEAQRRSLVGAEHLVRHAERARVERDRALDRGNGQYEVVETDDFHVTLHWIAKTYTCFLFCTIFANFSYSSSFTVEEWSAAGNEPALTSFAYCLIPVTATSVRLAKRFVNFGLKSVSAPSRSWQRRIWPSVPTPAPMPMVGMVSCSEIRRAILAGTASNSSMKQPASSIASASSTLFMAASAVRPWIL